MSIKLYDHQKQALPRMKTGCILNGGTGSGKSLTALAYYFTQEGGILDPYGPMENPRDLYIITTAMKRDKKEWQGELANFLMHPEQDEDDLYRNKIVIDSWNNIKKYISVKGAFFIFDEDKVTGNGVWVDAFLKITKSNDWIILSSTPGDKWEDYMAVFMANGFYRTRTEFRNEHLVYSPYVKYKVDRYLGVQRLENLRERILIDMDFDRHTTQHHEDVLVKYDTALYKEIMRTRKDPYNLQTNFRGDLVPRPIQQAADLCYVLRKIVNSDESRQVALLEIFEKHSMMIVFYNFDYELDILKNLYYGEGVEVAEWNGHAHQPVPESGRWVYLVQYTAGCEGWNCITTDTIVFYSQTYSYKTLQQAIGRIDRLNTPFMDLYYYHLKTRSGIDLAISNSLRRKKKFNERKFLKW